MGLNPPHLVPMVLEKSTTIPLLTLRAYKKGENLNHKLAVTSIENNGCILAKTQCYQLHP